MDEKIYVDASQPASLLDGAAVTDCPTLQEAIIAWRHLPKERQRTATIRTAANVFTVQEIERLYHGVEPEEPREATRPFQPDPSKWGTSTFDAAAARIATSRSQRNDAVLNSGGTQVFSPPEPNPIATLESAPDRAPLPSGEISPTIQATPITSSGVAVAGREHFPSSGQISPTIQVQPVTASPEIRVEAHSGGPLEINSEAHSAGAGTAPHEMGLETGKYGLEGGSISAGAGGLAANADVRPAETAQRSLRVSRVFRDDAARAEGLARSLATTIREETDRLKGRNDPEWRDQIDFLELVAATLDQIAAAIVEARQATTAEEREKRFSEAEGLATSLAKAAKDFAERNYERVIDYGGYCTMTVLGTLLFTTMFGVSPEFALTSTMVLLGFSGKKKD